MSSDSAGPIHHVALRVADPERAAAFYAGVLGLRESRRMEDAPWASELLKKASPAAERVIVDHDDVP